MKQQKLLFASVFIFALVTAGVIWKEKLWGPANSPVITTAGLGMADAQPLVPSAQEETIFYGPEPLPEGSLLSTPPVKKRKRLKAPVVSDARPMSAGSPMITGSFSPQSPDDTSLALGFDAGFDYFIPHVKLQQTVSNYLVVGTHFAYLQNITGPKAEVLGGGVNASYYWNGQPLNGPFVDVGMAAYRFTTTTTFRSSLATPLATSVSVGWSGSVGDTLYLSLAAGGQYIHNFGRLIGDIQFDGVQPLVRTGLGIKF